MAVGNSMEGEFYHYLRAAGHCTREWNQQILGFYAPYFAGCERILDVGCGEGQFLAMMRGEGHQVVGIDSDAHMVATCREQGLDVVEADLFDYLSRSSGQFDGIFCSNVIEHLPSEDAERLAKMAFEALRPGGLLLIATPNPESAIVHMHEFWRDATHVRLYNRPLLEFLLLRAGFRDVASAENPRTIWEPPPMEILRLVEESRLREETTPRSAPRPTRPASLSEVAAGGSIWNPPVRQQRSGLRMLFFSLRRRLAGFVARTLLFEELSYIETRLVAMQEGFSDELSGMETRLSGVEERLNQAGLLASELATRWREFLSRPREVFAVGIKPGEEARGLPFGVSQEIGTSRGGAEQSETGRTTDRVAPPVASGLAAAGGDVAGLDRGSGLGAADQQNSHVGETVPVQDGSPRRPRLRVAFFTPYLPYPLNSGGKIRSFYFLTALAARYDVDLYTVYYGGTEPEGLEIFRQCCRHVRLFRLDKWWRTRDRLRRVLDPLPRSVDHFHTDRSLTEARAALQQEPCDLLVADEICMTPYAELVADLPRIVLRQKVDHLHYAEMARARPWGSEKLLDAIEARKLERYEREKMSLYQAFVACSEGDASVFRRHAPAVPALVIPNGVDLGHFTSSPATQREPATILFVGAMSFYPNVDALDFFFETMYDAIRRAVPEVRVWIVGHSPPPEVLRLARLPGVEVIGSVPDVRPYYSRATVFVVPLRLGYGTRLKIVEAMAMALPVVSTTVGAQGLDVHSGQDILLADDPEAFAEGAVRLLTDPELRDRIGEGGRRLAQRYDWGELTKPFVDLVGQMAQAWGKGER